MLVLVPVLVLVLVVVLVLLVVLLVLVLLVLVLLVLVVLVLVLLVLLVLPVLVLCWCWGGAGVVLGWCGLQAYRIYLAAGRGTSIQNVFSPWTSSQVASVENCFFLRLPLGFWNGTWNSIVLARNIAITVVKFIMVTR